MRYRRTPGGKLQSNTNIYKWSDGSTTIAVGDQHYELQTKPLAPLRGQAYKDTADSHSYLASPSIRSQLLVTVGHMTAQLIVKPNKEIEDDALERLSRSMAAATQGANKAGGVKGPAMISNTQDPELQKKRAELAEKERMKMQRRRETAAEKANHTGGGRRGLGGLNVDDLEGRAGRRAPAGRKPPGAKRPRRRAEYDSDDDLPSGRTREDEYDKEDDFLASSDEEAEDAVEEEEEEEEMTDEEKEAPRQKKQKTRPAKSDAGSDVDAEADMDDDEEPTARSDEPNAAANRGRKRNVIEDDESDE